MPQINVGRWLAGGLAAGTLLLAVDVGSFPLYRSEYEAAFATHSLTPMAGRGMLFGFGQIVLSGFVLVFLYVAMRPRFGAGPRTALIAATTLWVARWLTASLYYRAIGLFPNRMLVTWLGIGFTALVAAALLGAWIYREAD